MVASWARSMLAKTNKEHDQHLEVARKKYVDLILKTGDSKPNKE